MKRARRTDRQQRRFGFDRPPVLLVCARVGDVRPVPAGYRLAVCATCAYNVLISPELDTKYPTWDRVIRCTRCHRRLKRRSQ
jgi:hypothetical protein